MLRVYLACDLQCCHDVTRCGESSSGGYRYKYPLHSLLICVTLLSLYIFFFYLISTFCCLSTCLSHSNSLVSSRLPTAVHDQATLLPPLSNVNMINTFARVVMMLVLRLTCHAVASPATIRIMALGASIVEQVRWPWQPFPYPSKYYARIEPIWLYSQNAPAYAVIDMLAGLCVATATRRRHNEYQFRRLPVWAEDVHKERPNHLV